MFNGAREHIATRIEQEANKGSGEYSFKFDKFEEFCMEEALPIAIEICRELEQFGYNTILVDYGNEYWVNLYLHITWNKQEAKVFKGFGYEGKKIYHKTVVS